MALLEGKKRWLLYPKEEAPLLYPIWPEGCHDPVFEADLDNPDATRTPAALMAKGFSCVLEAGASPIVITLERLLAVVCRTFSIKGKFLLLRGCQSFAKAIVDAGKAILARRDVFRLSMVYFVHDAVGR